jgi:hypothetical protein
MARTTPPPTLPIRPRRLRLALTFLVLAIPLAIWATMLAQWPQEQSNAWTAYLETRFEADDDGAAALRYYRDVELRGSGFVVAGVVLAVSAVCVYQITALVVPPARPLAA